MTPASRPAAEPFDPASGELAPSLERVLTDSLHPVLLLVASDADSEAARLAIDLAEARATRGYVTVLADADLDAPRLHDELGAQNLEGLVDIFLFGASLRRVALRPGGRHFAFVPAGAYAPDPAEVLQSPRWGRIAEELSGDGALLLVFLPAAAPGARQLSARIGRAVVLGDDRAVQRVVERLDPSCRILAAVRPGHPASAVADAAAEEPPLPPIPGVPDLSEPLVDRPRRRKRRLSPYLVAGLLIALVAAGWFGYRELFGGEPAPPPPVVDTPEPTEPGSPVETAIPYSVAVEAHQDLATAAERVQLLNREEPDIVFHLAPVSIRGDLFYRLLAGPLEDRESAMALMERLVEDGHKSGMDDWALLATTHTFHLGDYESREQAEARVDALGDEGIPAYVVAQRYESGLYRYRVYGGAYQNQAEAEVMREMLRNANEPARLVPRVGEPVG